MATIPIKAGSKMPALASWKPYQTQLPTVRDLEVWFASGRYGLAVITGWRGLLVLDWDDWEAYYAWAPTLDPDRRRLVEWTYRVITGRGLHLYFYCKEETASTPGEKWDVKAAGGYVLAPPSIHPSGHRYMSHSSPDHIRQIASIWWLLGIEKPEPPKAILRSSTDPFDMAYNDSGGTSIAEIKAQHSLASMLGVSLSSRVQKMQCPLPGHADEHESFVLYPDHYHCYGCGAHGDVIDFWASMRGISLIEAMRELSNG